MYAIVITSSNSQFAIRIYRDSGIILNYHIHIRIYRNYYIISKVYLENRTRQ